MASESESSFNEADSKPHLVIKQNNDVQKVVFSWKQLNSNHRFQPGTLAFICQIHQWRLKNKTLKSNIHDHRRMALLRGISSALKKRLLL